MKRINKSILFTVLLSLIALFVYAKQEKVLRIFSDGNIIQEYSVSDIDYVEVCDLVDAPSGVTAKVSDNTITITWEEVPNIPE